MKIFIGALALTLASSGGLQASLVYSFGPDNVNDPRSFTSINTLTSTAGSLYNMNDLNDGFNGGLTLRPITAVFYAILNHTTGESRMSSFPVRSGSGFSHPL